MAGFCGEFCPDSRRSLGSLRRRGGAGIAWILGVIPSTIANLIDASSQSESPSSPQISTSMVLLAAAGMGMCLGAILAVPQWFVWRWHVRHAGWWIVGNAAAWMFGMVVVFAGTGAVSESFRTATIIGIVAASCLAGGLTVGAVHGLVLVRLISIRGERNDDCQCGVRF